MKYENVSRTIAQSAVLLIVFAAPSLGCGDARGGSGSGTEPVTTSEQELRGSRSAECRHGNDGGDPPGDPPSPNDCGANDTRPCRVTTAFTFGRTFTNLQAAINAAPDGDVVTVTGHCGSASVVDRVGLTIQGPFPVGGCGFNGPSPGALRAEVAGLDVEQSTNVSVRFLNLVNSSGSNAASGHGLNLVDSTTPLVSCNCAAFNDADGFNIAGTQPAVVSQNRSEVNGDNGIESSETSTIIIGNNTVVFNQGNGIFVHDATNNNVSFNIVTDNSGDGILLQNVTASLVTGNTIRRNGDGLIDRIVCEDSSAFGSNVPPSCQ